MTRPTNHRLPSWHYRELDQLAVEFLSGLKLTHMPISGFELAQLKGFTVTPYPKHKCAERDAMMSVSEDAFSIINEDGVTIFHNDERPYERINFSITHEICHIVLDHREHSHLGEREANHMAGYILASPIFIEALRIDSAEALAQTCHISRQCALSHAALPRMALTPYS